MYRYLQKYKYQLLFLGLAVLVLWQMLLPGYVLTLDMVFTPQLQVHFSQDAFNNMLPVWYSMKFLNLFLAGWLVQKIMLLSLFFCLGWIPFRYLPEIVGREERTEKSGELYVASYPPAVINFAAAVFYALNPFVYGRFLAGHWSHLFAYAFLPMCMALLLRFGKQPNLKNSLKLFGSLFLISIFSLHFFVMAGIIVGLYGVKKIASPYKVQSPVSGTGDSEPKTHDFRLTDYRLVPFRSFFVGCLLLLVASSYWLIPAFHRTAPIEQRFTQAHWEVFAASGHGKVGTFLNLATLNGFWAEREAWRTYFLWPQEHVWFWAVWLVIFIIIIFGIVSGFKNKKTRQLTLGLLSLATCSLLLATGASATWMHPINIFLYEHLPLWSGFRDSQKFIGLLALCYALFFGLGATYISDQLSQKKNLLGSYSKQCAVGLCLVMGFYLLGGFQKQLRPVWYPASWYEAKEVVKREKSIEHSAQAKILVLPWHGYLSLNFNRNLIVANPLADFFGSQAVGSRNVELGTIYDQEQDKNYALLDLLVRGKIPVTHQAAVAMLQQRNISYILYIQDLKNSDPFSYNYFLDRTSHKIQQTPEIEVYKVE